MNGLTAIASSEQLYQNGDKARKNISSGHNIHYPTLDKILVADRIYNLVVDGPNEKKIEEKAIQSLPGYARHSLVILCSYYDPLKHFEGLKIAHGNNIIQEPIDIFNNSDEELKKLLNRARGKEGIISLVIGDGKYQLMYSGIKLPEGSEENILALYKKKYKINTIKELKKKLSLSDEEFDGFKMQAILRFSPNYTSGDYAPWFLKINGKGPQIFYKGKIL